MTATRLFERAVIRLAPQDEGEDVAAFLQGLVTNDVTGDLPVYAALLSAQGKTIVWRGGKDLLLDCRAEEAGDLAKRLSLYRLRRRIAISLDETLAVHWSAGERADATPDPRLPQLGWRWISTSGEKMPLSGGANRADDHAGIFFVGTTYPRTQNYNLTSFRILFRNGENSK